jgi:hypothetical protein
MVWNCSLQPQLQHSTIQQTQCFVCELLDFKPNLYQQHSQLFSAFIFVLSLLSHSESSLPFPNAKLANMCLEVVLADPVLHPHHIKRSILVEDAVLHV